MKKLLTKIGFTLLALIIGLSPLLPTMPVEASTLKEDNANWNGIGGDGLTLTTDRLAQTWTAASTYLVSSVTVKLKRSGATAGNTIIELQGIAATKPNNVVLATSSMATNDISNAAYTDYSFVLTVPYTVTNGVQYAWVARQTAFDGGGHFIWGTSAGNTYAGGAACGSADSGVTYSGFYANDEYFRNYGDVNPAVTTIAANGITATTASLNATIDTLGIQNDVNFYFGWRADGEALYTHYTAPQVCIVPSPKFFNLTGLTPGTLYHFAAFVDDIPHSAGPWQGAELDFTTLDAMAVQTNPADFITTHSAVLQGELTNDGTFDGIATGFVWDTATHAAPGNVLPAASGYASNSLGFPASLDVAGDFSWPILCVPNSTYYFRAYASKGGNTVYGNELIFTAINTSYVSLLEVETDAADDLANTTATLNGELITIGTYPAIVGFDYGQFSGNWTQVVADTLLAPAVFDYAAVGLDIGTTYYVRAFALDAYGYKYGAILTFDTTGAHAVGTDLRVETNQAETNSATEMRLFGSLLDVGMNTTVSLDFDYGTTVGYGQNTSNVSRSTEGGYSVLVTGLVEGTLYHYRAMGLGSSGEAAVGADKTFIAGFTSVLPATPTPTGTPLPTSTGIPIPPPPGGWGDTSWHYFLLVIALVCAPLFLMFIVGGQIGKFLSIIVDVAIFAGWLMVGWIEVYGIILTCLAAGSFIFWLIRPKAA